MKYQLVIDAETATLVDNPTGELAYILDAARREVGRIPAGAERTLRDRTGKTVGFHRVDWE